MRVFTTVVASVALVYGGYWFVGQEGVEKAAIAAIETYENEGWTVNYDSLDTVGFPSRFDTKIENLSIRSPNGNFGWDAPNFQIFSLSYSPNKIIAAWPENQTLILGSEPIAIDSTGMRASAHFGLSTSLPLDHATMESGAVSLTGAFGTISADHVLAAIRPTGAVASYDIWLDANQITLPSLTGVEQLNLGKLDATIELSDEIKARDDVLPVLNSAKIRDLRLDWEDMGFSVSGEFVVDGNGFPEGRITISARNMPVVIDRLEAAGVIAPDVAVTYRNVARSMQAREGSVEVPLSMRGGMLAFGPFPLASLPKLR